MIRLGLSRSAYSDYTLDFRFVAASLLATIVMAATIYVCFAYSDQVERLLGHGGTDIAVRLSAFVWAFKSFGPERVISLGACFRQHTCQSKSQPP